MVETHNWEITAIRSLYSARHHKWPLLVASTVHVTSYLRNLRNVCAERSKEISFM